MDQGPRRIVRALALLAMISAACLWSPPARPGEISDELERLEQRAYSATLDEMAAEIERIEPRMANAAPRLRTRFTLLKARWAALANKTDQALDALTGLLEGETPPDRDLRLRTLNLATNVLIVNDAFEAGFDYFRTALELAPAVEAPKMRADTYNVAAELHARIAEYATAIEYANLAMAEVGLDQAPRHHCIALERRARARQGLGALSAAEADYRRASELCESVPDLIFTGTSLLGLAQTMLERDDPEGAEDTLRRAIDRLARGGFSDGELEARTELARLLLDRGRVDSARSLMEPTWRWIEQSGSRAARARAMEVHARLAEAANDSRSAYEYTRKAAEFGRQHAERTRRMRLTLLLSAQDEQSREKELELLRAHNNVAKLDRESRRQQDLATAYAGAGAAIAGMLLISLLVKAARDRREFQRLSERDGLTGLLNHTRFFELAHHAFQRARHSGTPFTLIVADVDLFKQVNDDYGHLVGDSVLARIGARIRSAFGPGAIVGRLGGEEFGIALSDCDTETAVARIEHLRATLNRQRSDDTEPSITMSFGVAELSRERSLEVLYAHADQALYDAKDSGRNRVITVARINLGAGGFVT